MWNTLEVNNKENRATPTLEIFLKKSFIIGAVLVSLLSTLNIFHILFLIVNFEHVTAGRGSDVAFSNVTGFQAYDDVNNPVSSSSELHQNIINLIIIFSYKPFLFYPMQIYILKQRSPLKSA